MASPGSSARITLDDALEAFDRVADVGEPLTASEVAEALDCSRRTAYDKLDALADRGDLRSKKTGARGRVWWRPAADRSAGTADQSTLVEAQFDEFVRAVTDYAIFLLDPEGTIRSWNDGAERIKGYDEADILGEHFSTFYPEGDREAGVPERNLAAAAEEGHVEDEGWRVRQDGTRFWANVTISSLRGDEGEPQGFLKVTRDMTERHEHEETLRREKERFESLVQEVEDYAIFMLDPEGHVQSWNRGIERIKGYTADEIVGEHYSVFYPESAREEGVPERNLEAAARAGRVEDEGWRIRKDGSRFRANVVITALEDDEGELRGFAKVTRDVTERHEYEQQLLRQRNELDELNRINADIRDIDRALVSATTREEIEASVCDRLADSAAYSGAWMAEYTADYEELVVRVSAGIDEDSLDRILVGEAPDDDPAPVERALGRTAMESGTVQTGAVTRTSARSGVRNVAFGSVAVVPLVYHETEYGVLAVYSEDEDGFDDRQTAVLDELGETISHAIAAVKRKERERTLTALHDSTRELLRAEAVDEIADVVVRAATTSLDLPAVVLYRFDKTENVLSPLAVSPLLETLAPPPQFTPGDDSPLWSCFVDGETVIGEASDAELLPGGSARDVRQALAVPVGEHGVIAVGRTDRGAIDPNTRKLVELLAATTQAAFTRVENEANLRERDTVLQEQNRRLQWLNQLNGVVREVDQQLVGSMTREAIQREVCELLTSSERFRLAWMAELDTAGDALVPLEWAGTGQDYLDDVSFEGNDPAADPAVRTAHTGTITVVSNIADDLRAAPWRKAAFSREFQSAISVPVTYGERSYGVLTVYADRPGLFGEMEQSILAELGQTIANAINTAEMKQALFADKVVELQFRLPSTAEEFFAQLARDTGSRFEFEGLVPTAEGGLRVFFTSADGSTETILDKLAESMAVETARSVADHDEGGLFEAVLTGQSIVATLVDHNASLRSLIATPEGVQVTVEIPSRSDVRDFIERFQTAYPDVEFVARRDRNRSIETQEGFRARLESSLTDRQREVLELAYFGGFFESPRRSNGRDIAETLGVSQPTVANHLRAAQRKVLDQVLEDQARHTFERPGRDARGD